MLDAEAEKGVNPSTSEQDYSVPKNAPCTVVSTYGSPQAQLGQEQFNFTAEHTDRTKV
jgi:hypothetical protein